jgi:hypothetical protein
MQSRIRTWLVRTLALAGLAVGAIWAPAPAQAATPLVWLGADMNPVIWNVGGAGNVFIQFDGTWIQGGIQSLNGDNVTVSGWVQVIQCRPNENYPCGGVVTTSNPFRQVITGDTFIGTVPFRAQAGHKYYATGHFDDGPVYVDAEGATLNAAPHVAAGRWICVGASNQGFLC